MEDGGEEKEFLHLSRIRKFMRKVMDEKRDGGAVATMRGISKRVDPEPRNESKMKRSRTGATYTNLMVRWSGCQRVRFLQAAEEVCERSLKKEKKKRSDPCRRTIKDEERDGKKKVIQEEGDKLRRWGLCWGDQVRIQNIGDSMLLVNWKINGTQYRSPVHRTQKTDLRLLSGHLGLFHHIFRDWSEGADQLTRNASEGGPSWRGGQKD